jgi:uncharacterized membrane protein
MLRFTPRRFSLSSIAMLDLRSGLHMAGQVYPIAFGVLTFRFCERQDPMTRGCGVVEGGFAISTPGTGQSAPPTASGRHRRKSNGITTV